MNEAKKGKKAFPAAAVGIAAILLLAGGAFVAMNGGSSKKDGGTPAGNLMRAVTGQTPEAPEKIDGNTESIDPDSFASLSDFLGRIQKKKGVDLDLSKEPFVIVIKGDKGDTYVPIDRELIENEEVNANRKALNAAISDIFDAYKNGKIYRTKNSQGAGTKIGFGKEYAHPFSSTINGIHSLDASMYDIRKELESKERLSKFGSEVLAYLYEFEGRFDKTEEVREKACKEYPDTCKMKLTTYVVGKARDQAGNPVSGAKITLQNDEAVTTTTKEDGSYELKFETYPLSHLHLKAQYPGHSDGYADSLVNFYSGAPYFYDVKDFVLNKANVVAESDSAPTDGDYYVFRTQQSEYRVPKNGLKYEDGRAFPGGKFSVYMYEFKKSDNIDSLANSPTFQPVQGYVGNLMKTFGMPYIQFFDENGKELFVHSSNPMILKNKIYHMKELYENHDKIYEALTKEDMEFLVKYSKEKGGFPIDFKFQVENNLLRWPAWWALDRKRGVWDNIGSRVIDVDGTIETPFYSVKDF